MASIYKRGNIWWVKWTDHESDGVVVRETLGLRCDIQQEDRRARRMVDKYTTRESAAKVRVKRFGLDSKVVDSAWSSWVFSYLEAKYVNARTLERYKFSLVPLFYWCRLRGVKYPSQIMREHGADYLVWRTSSKKIDEEDKHYPFSAPKWGKVCRNSAIRELGLMSALLNEAMIRGFIDYNVLSRLGFKKEAVKVKLEISLDQERVIRERLVGKPEWMRVSFNIAMAQGCRLSETRMNIGEQVNLGAKKLLFFAKGRKVYTVRMNDDLFPMFESFIKDGREFTMPEMPIGSRSRDWRVFFDACGFPDLSFHCTRVTAITRAHRAGVSRTLAMAFFNHASDVVHRIYTRLGSDDTDVVADALRSEFKVDW